MAPSSSLRPLFCSCPCAPAPLCSAPLLQQSIPSNQSHVTHHQPHASRPVHRILRGSSCPIRIDCHGHSNYLFFDRACAHAPPRCGRLQARRRTERLPTFSPFAIAIDLRAALSPRALTALGLPRAPRRRRRRRRRQKLLVLDTVVMRRCARVRLCVPRGGGASSTPPASPTPRRRARRLRLPRTDAPARLPPQACARRRSTRLSWRRQASVGGVRGFR